MPPPAEPEEKPSRAPDFPKPKAQAPEPPRSNPPAAARAPCVVILKHGARFEGDLVEEKPDSVTLSTSRGKMCFPRAQIRELRRGDGSAPAPDAAPPPAKAPARAEKPPAEPEGEPDDAPAQAYRAVRAALMAGDIPALSRLSAAAHRKEFEDPDILPKLGFARALLPQEVEILSSRSLGDSATVILAEKGGQQRKGKAVFVREEGEWRMENESWDALQMGP